MKWNCTSTLAATAATCLATASVVLAGGGSTAGSGIVASVNEQGLSGQSINTVAGAGSSHLHPVEGTAEPVLLSEKQISLPTTLAGDCPPGVIYSNFGAEDAFEFFEGFVLTPQAQQRVLADTVFLKETGDVNSIGYTLANLAGSTLLSANVDIFVWELETDGGGNILEPVMGDQILQRNINLPDLDLPPGTITILFEEADPGETIFTANPPSGALWVGIRVRTVNFEFGGTIFNVGPGIFAPGVCGTTDNVVWEQGVGLFGFDDIHAGLGFQLGIDAPGACCIGDDPGQCIPDQTLAQCELDHGGQYLGAGTDCADCPAAVECRINCPDEGVPCPGDLDDSGAVNVDDLLIVLNNWGDCPGGTPGCPGDADDSGTVNVDDLLIVLNNWGDCPAAATITDDENSFCEPEECVADIESGVNSGCNFDDPIFPNDWTAIADGQTVCGTIWAELQDPQDPDSGARDTDWYTIEVTEDSTITFSVHAEFAASAFIANTDCGDDTFEIFATETSPFPGTPFDVSLDVPPGSYSLIVTTDAIFEGISCVEGNNYTASVSVAPTTTLGACCVDGGQCLDSLSLSQCDAEGGTWAWPFVECGDAASACGGDTCENAREIEIGGAPVAINLDGNLPPEQTLSVCTNGDNPNDVPVAWYTVTGNGETLRAATCGSDIANVSVSVYCGQDCDFLSECLPTSDVICSGQLGQFQHDWCSVEGTQYWVVVHQNTQATQPLAPVQLQVTQVGTGGCTPPDIDCPTVEEPVCDLTELAPETCQIRSGGTYVTSDNFGDDTGFQAADDFVPAVSTDINSLCWQGVELFFEGGFGVCPNNNGQGSPFRIRYYEDNSGIPGTMIAEFNGTPNSARVDFIGFGFGNAALIDYTLDHAPVSVNAGQCYWVEVVQITEVGDCWFLWSPSEQGNQISFQTDFDTTYGPTDVLGPGDVTNPDRTFCVGVELAEPGDCVGEFEGACCSGDTCVDNVLGDTCTAPGECFFPLQTCAEVACPEGDYRYDCGATNNAIGLIDGGVMAWVHLFEPIGGQDTITEISTSFGLAGSDAIGVVPGQQFGVALFESVDEGGGALNLGDLIWAGSDTADASAIGTDGFQTVAVNPGAGGELVTGPFFVFAWVAQASGEFPAPIQGDANAEVGLVWAYGLVGEQFGFTDFDPANLDQSNPDEFFIDFFAADLVNGPWLLRANGSSGAAQMIPVPRGNIDASTRQNDNRRFAAPVN